MHYSSITALSADIAARRISPVEVTEHMLARIDALEPTLNAYVSVTAERALAQARTAEAEIAAGKHRGPLHGVPLSYKDILFSDFARTTAGTRIHKDFVPGYTATCIARLEAAGAVTLGKVKTTEQAYATHHPDVTPPANPWSAGHWSGSSSSGSGVSVAAGLAFASLGSDTGGSIRFPSAVNGVTGLKPTWGRVSRHGAFELAASLDHIGPLARSAGDAGIVLQAMAGADVNDPTALLAPVPDYAAQIGASVAGLRIGIDRAYIAEGVDPANVAAIEEAARVLQSLGAVLVDVTVEGWKQAAIDWLPLCAPETAAAHDATFPARRSDYGENLAALIDMAESYTTRDVARAHQTRLTFSAQLAAMFHQVDLLLIPATIWRVPDLAHWADYAEGDNSEFIRFTGPFDMSGSPTLTMPGGFDQNGLPLAVQLVAPHLQEGRLVRAGSAFQQVTDWHLHHPDLG
ncbi:Asp-tRNA(Asn)/Glu-tRNA(Gln) amidotransferase GatCAB subunit A [Pseudooceanicola sp. GBMRC 2024]|uniref:Asp-tRNA(Asn)/Glu-tRNA(Gln) amidotransferase GatCAB subunit A n=1 Tax=Pseudooceanicola albus TaxID=2692189 RepID=A0A6L7G1E0_9RHOB|nr:amidase [Pseudooceanicola albus]MXN17851.1 Asp-tRNA(Asn)/Glu-tRNA(Gln) amidotransferase GatCAB subunit A [Pseudooceanicola albus]